MLGVRITDLEDRVAALTHAVVILVNAKEKKSVAILPPGVRYRKPRIEVQWSDDENGKSVGRIVVRLQED